MGDEGKKGAVLKLAAEVCVKERRRHGPVLISEYSSKRQVTMKHAETY